MYTKIVKILTVLAVVFLVIFVQQFPNIYALWHTPEGYTYNYQASWFDPWDVNVYVAAIRDGQNGRVLLKNHYTTIPIQPSFIYPVYTLAGQLSQQNPYIVFHVLASLISIFTVLVIFYCYKRIFSSFTFAILATIICLFGGGIGALLGKTDISAASQITSFSFQSASQRAHEGIGIVLYIVALVATYYYFESKKSKKTAVLIIVSLLLEVLFYPYYLLSYLLITFIFLYGKLKTLTIRPYLFLIFTACIVGPATFLYYLHLRSTTFSAATLENLPNISLPSLLIGYGGFLLFFSILSFIERKEPTREHARLKFFLIIWIVISIVLSYIPGLGFSRFYLRGLFFPLSGLVFLNILYIKNHAVQYVVTLCVVAILLFSRLNIFLLRLDVVNEINPWVYTENAVIDALEFLKTSPQDGVISSSYPINNLIPAYTGKRVYFGHVLQTPSAEERVLAITNFYSGKLTEEEASDFLRQNNINYVFYYDEPATLPIPSYQFMQSAFENERVQIFTLENTPHPNID